MFLLLLKLCLFNYSYFFEEMIFGTDEINYNFRAHLLYSFNSILYLITQMYSCVLNNTHKKIKCISFEHNQCSVFHNTFIIHFHNPLRRL